MGTVILLYLIDGKLGYNELTKETPSITERTLGLLLKLLEEDGLIKRDTFFAPVFVYSFELMFIYLDQCFQL